ncbi:EF-P 5-aminopentanol modification-associated protein YfmH [Lactococcus nasutitermitis]|uniref:EF-P 5-aminopentanol modification-associated protein YfmH n=1 Tax=Lactococcus nasutitermitis TaxID=1652957 RepID=A0ABV9JBN1_9LACT|nr:pitrilysin family protein [Lactococcus nasutitermitis]
MKKIFYERVGETLFVDVLENGLTVYYLPKADYNRTFGLFTTKFGSLDTTFTPVGKLETKTFPEGIAHFLEHKLFEKKEGDVMYKFGALGAQTNAFTSFSRTSYLFSTQENSYPCVELLLDFVQEPYFTAENVTKEQGIIQQEIQMYQDESDWRLFAGLLSRMYPNSPLAADIAGTPATIDAITAEDLYENYETFYQPKNMNLFLTGPFDVEKMSNFVRENQAKKDFVNSEVIKRETVKASEPISGETLALEVAMPKFALGLRGEDKLPENPVELLKYKLSMSLYLDLLFAPTSQLYEKLYQSGLIDDSFETSFEFDERFHFVALSGDTENPEKLSEVLQEALKSYKIESDFSEEHLDLLKRDTLGDYFSSLNSLEYIANQFSSALYDKVSFFELPEILSKLTLTEISDNAEKFIQEMKVVEFTILPK